MIRENGDVGKDADAEPVRHRGPDAGEIRAGVGDAPGAASPLERMHRALAVETA